MLRSILALALLWSAPMAQADNLTSPMMRFIDRHVMTWANDARLISALVSHRIAPLDQFLQARIDTSEGRIHQISLTNEAGATIAGQGGQPRFQDVTANDCVHQRHDAVPWQFEILEAVAGPGSPPQVSARFALTDPANGQVIGILTVELDRDAFF
jgi:hypothetical protein